jgi:hypothetical protein
LGDREKIVLSLYYYENLTLAQIGQVLGVTESRIIQIHTKAVMRLRGMGGADGGFAGVREPRNPRRGVGSGSMELPPDLF